MTAALSVSGLTKRYRRRTVLDGVSFEVADGAATALLGVNGAGKSTLIRAVLDLVDIEAGSIALFGKPHHKARAREPLAYLGERFLPPHFARGREVLTLLCRLHGVPFDAARAAVECKALELDVAALERPAREYSKGMLQKLGLVACLLANRPLLLLDEPMSGLDPQAHALIRERLRALRASGTTLFFSTHALRDVAELCERVVVLHAGRVRFDGTVRELALLHPAQDLERAFLSLIATPPADAAA
jgi:ABC-2 type transport system ATP-binding protein